MTEANDPHVDQPPVLMFMAGIMTAVGPLFFLFIALNLILTILMVPFCYLKYYNRGASGVPTDLAFLLRSAAQARAATSLPTARLSCVVFVHLCSEHVMMHLGRHLASLGGTRSPVQASTAPPFRSCFVANLLSRRLYCVVSLGMAWLLCSRPCPLQAALLD